MKYIVTSAQLGARLNKNFYKNLLLFKKQHKVDKIYVFVMNGKYISDEVLHPSVAELPDIEIITNLNIHSKVRLYDSKVLAQNIDPMLGLSNKLPSQYSYILPATRVRYKSIPNIGTLPRFFVTTGSLTEPYYKTNTNKGRKAHEEHQMGFTYFQDLGGGKIDIYPLTAKKNGNFHYLKEEYRSGNLIKHNSIPVLVLGDWHTGDTNPEIKKVTVDMIKELNPKEVFFHDLFNGHSINHHEKGKLLSSLRNIGIKRVSLEDELKEVLKEVNFFAGLFPDTKFHVVESNHDLFIKKYIEDKYFVYDDANFLQTIKILPKIISEHSIALKEALLTCGELPSNFIFHRENDSYRKFGIELAQHGHKGSNGSRGSSGQFKKLNVRTATAHTHTPEIFGSGIVVGTSTYLELPYTMGGMSSWLNAHGIVNPDGTLALVTMIPKSTKKK